MPVEWEMTPAAFGGRKAIVKLDTGARIEGNWLGVTPTTFTIDVERSRGKNQPRRGVHTLDRSAIVELRLQEKRIRGRVWGTVFGFVAGSSALSVVHGRSWEQGRSLEKKAGPALGVFYGVLVASYMAGRAFDKATRVVLIKRESPQSGGLRDLEGTGLSIPPEAIGLEEAKENMSHETTDTGVVGSGAAVRRATIADRVGDDDRGIRRPEGDCETR